MNIAFELNGKRVEADIPVRTTLVDCIRHHFMQTGTHVGCEHGVCGACTVIVDGEAVRSCLMLAVQADGSKVTTVEGLTPPEGLSPLQASFRKHHALQCGFCTPGIPHDGPRAAHAGAEREQGTNPPRALRKSLPLHGLYQHHRSRLRRPVPRTARTSPK